jgi:hypothetical protein
VNAGCLGVCLRVPLQPRQGLASALGENLLDPSDLFSPSAQAGGGEAAGAAGGAAAAGAAGGPPGAAAAAPGLVAVTRAEDFEAVLQHALEVMCAEVRWLPAVHMPIPIPIPAFRYERTT